MGQKQYGTFLENDMIKNIKPIYAQLYLHMTVYRKTSTTKFTISPITKQCSLVIGSNSCWKLIYISVALVLAVDSHTELREL